MSTTRHRKAVAAIWRRPLLWVAAGLALAVSVAPCLGATDPGRGGPLWTRTDLGPECRVLDSHVCDLDGDGGADLLISERGRRGPWWTVALRGATGEELWRRDHAERPVLAVAPTPTGGAVFAFAVGRRAEVVDTGTGVTVLSTDLPSAAGRLAIGEMDGDGRPDVVCAIGPERDDTLLALSGSDLSVIWSAAAEPDDSRYGEGFGKMACADSDGDGIDEVFAVENTDVLVRLDGGTRRWSANLGERTVLFPKGAATSVPVVADLTGDGSNEVAVGCLAGGLVVLSSDAGELAATLTFGVEAHEGIARRRRVPSFLKQLLAESGEPVNELLAVELNARPGAELVFGCSDGFVYAASARSGETLWRFDSEGQVYERPIPLDASRDGVSDIIAWDSERGYLLNGRTGEPIPGLPPSVAPSGFHVADVDSDGELELVAVATGSPAVAVWPTGIAQTATAGDGEGGGAVPGQAEPDGRPATSAGPAAP